MKWYRVPVGDMDRPFIKRIKAGNKSICLVNHEGKLYALDTRCPHAGGDLSTGWCNNGKLVCPYHRYSYDLQTGKGSTGQNDYINTYPVEIKEQSVYIGVLSFWEKLTKLFN